ncbi:NAD(P)-dependent oxidoreductase [Mycobacterium hubeiense]|uniref:NAD(P)-dependent oxidoreductase n=1 Tax=Mycobacterium hubeiense TaxID=1867256 RepID=UPI000C7EDDBF|nr:NAD(P)H-binding protein [Mycobacterium sp. QGD 101]
MRIVIFGANGHTGRLLTRTVLDAGDTAVAVTRRPDTFPFADARLTVARADVRDGAAVKNAIEGADAVLSTLGVPFSRRAIDTYSVGIGNIVTAMQATRVRRLVAVSSSAVYHYPNRRQSSLASRFFELVISRTIGKTTYDDLRRMEEIIRVSGLDWTVIRPSGLFDLPEPTNYIAGEVDPVGGFTARIDLADYMAKLVDERSAIGKTVIISTTENTPTMWQVIRREAFKSA